MTSVVLLTGGNLGPVATTLSKARQLLIERVGPETGCSRVLESEPWGFEAPQRFLNQVLVMNTELEPLAVLDTTKQIERELGRIREPEIVQKIETDPAESSHHHRSARTYHSRPIDIDILFYGNRILDMPRLCIPHPLIGQRAFVLRPLVEVLPEYIHPVTGLTLRAMLENLEHSTI